MKILIFGAQGMLGHDLCNRLSSNHDVVAHDKAQTDLTEKSAVQSTIESIQPALVVNASGYTDVDAAEAHSEQAFAINAHAIQNLVEAMPDAHQCIVHFSSDYVFDGRKGSPYIESDVAAPINRYGEAKLAGETTLIRSGQAHLIVRTSWLYGANGANFVKTMQRLASEQSSVNIVDDQISSPTWTRDLSEATTNLIEKQARGIYHVANSGYASWHQFATTLKSLDPKLKDLQLLPCSSDEYKRAAPRPLDSRLDCSKYASLIGQPLRSWQEALEDYIATLDDASNR